MSVLVEKVDCIGVRSDALLGIRNGNVKNLCSYVFERSYCSSISKNVLIGRKCIKNWANFVTVVFDAGFDDMGRYNYDNCEMHKN